MMRKNPIKWNGKKLKKIQAKKKKHLKLNTAKKIE